MTTDTSDKTPAPGAADDADCAGIENASVDARLQNCASAAANEKAPERAAARPASANAGKSALPEDKTVDRPDSEEAEEETEDFGRNAQETPWSG